MNEKKSGARAVQSVVKEMPPKIDKSLSSKGQEARQEQGPNRWLMNTLIGYEDVLRSVVDWHWECDAGLKMSHVSESFTEGLQVPAELGLGENLRRTLDREDGSEATSAALESLKSRSPFRGLGLKLYNRAGDAVVCRLTGVPIFDRTTGGFVGYRGTGVIAPPALEGAADRQGEADESAQDQLISLLERALARKDQLEWELSHSGRKSFESRIASITHELRTPLNAIIGFAEIIKRQAFGDDLERYVEYGSDIYNSGMHMVALVDSLIDLARIEREEDASELQPIVVRDFVSQSLRMVEDQASDAGVTLVNQVRGDLPSLQSEPRALRQILLNLLSNAVKYTPTGGIVGVEAGLEQGNMLRLAVWDTGIGIDQQEQERIFERNYRIQDEVNAGQSGSGLGLAISRDLARAIGGGITVESRPGEGARFTLRLALAQKEKGRMGAQQV
ncbi:MAG: HAMP domain-containing histidine kinase [Kiloniellales bacterium]|nr:HAMP domain-containing histidine kinase [Kiloniellales bacterium]